METPERPRRKRDAIPAGEKPIEFSENIEYDGLPYIFKGQINEREKDVGLMLFMPDWQGEAERVPNKFSVPGGLMNSGEIGYISLNRSGRRTDTEISRVRSYTEWLAEDSKYKHAHVGRFLMDNVIAIADAKKWSIHAFPYTDGRLSDQDVLDWLERKGFDHRGVRQPREPDATQPVLKHLRK